MEVLDTGYETKSAWDDYLSASNKCLKDYAVEPAYRDDTRRLPIDTKLKRLLWVTLAVGQSLWLRDYSQGGHWEDELLIDGALPAAGRGKEEGAKTKLSFTLRHAYCDIH